MDYLKVILKNFNDIIVKKFIIPFATHFCCPFMKKNFQFYFLGSKSCQVFKKKIIADSLTFKKYNLHDNDLKQKINFYRQNVNYSTRNVCEIFLFFCYCFCCRFHFSFRVKIQKY